MRHWIPLIGEAEVGQMVVETKTKSLNQALEEGKLLDVQAHQYVRQRKCITKKIAEHPYRKFSGITWFIATHYVYAYIVNGQNHLNTQTIPFVAMKRLIAQRHSMKR